RSGRELSTVHRARDSRVRIARAHLQHDHRRRRAVDRRSAPADSRAVPRRTRAAVVGLEHRRRRRVAGDRRSGAMNGVRTASDGVLIAVDGLDVDALGRAARAALESRARGGISKWDASGVFQELAVADSTAGAPSPRTLLLLYAADLAFRLRWQIRPALLEGRTVVAAPYVDTAVAFGRAAGLPVVWLTNLFRFAPRPGERHFVHP